MRKVGVESRRNGFGGTTHWQLIAPSVPLSETGANGANGKFGANGNAFGAWVDWHLGEGEL